MCSCRIPPDKIVYSSSFLPVFNYLHIFFYILAPSAASAVILGRTSNGNIDWKDDTGIVLKDINE